MVKYLPIYANGAMPELIEGDIFKTIVALPDDSMPNGIEVGIEVGIDNGIEKNVDKILAVISSNPSITQKRLAEAVGLSVRTVARELKSLQEANKVQRVGSDRAGYWKVVK
jgi:ATP-dependent DNA helicase RecG